MWGDYGFGFGSDLKLVQNLDLKLVQKLDLKLDLKLVQNCPSSTPCRYSSRTSFAPTIVVGASSRRAQPWRRLTMGG